MNPGSRNENLGAVEKGDCWKLYCWNFNVCQSTKLIDQKFGIDIIIFSIFTHSQNN